MEISISPTVWTEFLEMIDLGDIITPVEVFFGNDTAEVRASDKTKTIQFVMPQWTLFGTTVTNPTSIVIDPKEILADMKKFVKSRSITISTGDSEMTISDDKGNELHYPLKDKSAAITIPAAKIPSFDTDGKCLFKKKVKDADGNDSIVQGAADSVVYIDSTQVQLAVNDMVKHAKTEYVEFGFDASKSYSKTGHMETKAKVSTSGLTATLEGDPLKFTLPKTFAALVNPFEGEIQIQGTPDSPAIVFKHAKVDKGDIIVVLMRQRVGNGA